jgi:hypothetical protein
VVEGAVEVGEEVPQYGRVEAPGQKIALMVLLLLLEGSPAGVGRGGEASHAGGHSSTKSSYRQRRKGGQLQKWRRKRRPALSRGFTLARGSRHEITFHLSAEMMGRGRWSNRKMLEQAVYHEHGCKDNVLVY